MGALIIGIGYRVPFFKGVTIRGLEQGFYNIGGP